MSPIRLIILAGLCYLLFRLIFGGRREKTAAYHQSSPTPGQSQDVLVQDPVCNTYIPRGQAISLRDRNSTLYFCSEKCREAYLSEADNQSRGK